MRYQDVQDREELRLLLKFNRIEGWFLGPVFLSSVTHFKQRFSNNFKTDCGSLDFSQREQAVSSVPQKSQVDYSVE